MQLPVILLASQSPRRRELLKSMGLTVQVIDPDPDVDPETLEIPNPEEEPLSYVERVAMIKWQNAAHRISTSLASGTIPAGGILLSADTTVALDGMVLGKPVHQADAAAMLKALSGRSHQVHTAVCAGKPTGRYARTVTVSSEVTFAVLDGEWISRYCASGEPMDKAGAYGIQGTAGMMIPRICGSYTGIMGLPLYETWQLLQQIAGD
jgi:septum formation protein